MTLSTASVVAEPHLDAGALVTNRAEPVVESKASSPSDGAIPTVVRANVFVSGLSPDVCDRVLHEWFSPYGTIISARVMLDVKSGASRSFGFVMYDSDTAADTAIQRMHGRRIGNSLLKVKRANHDGANAAPDTRKIYVGNVPSRLSSEDVIVFFRKFGEVTQCVLRYDQSTNLQIAFIEFSDVATARSAAEAVHNTRPFGIKLPLIAKLAETSDMRAARHAMTTAHSSPSGTPPQPVLQAGIDHNPGSQSATPPHQESLGGFASTLHSPQQTTASPGTSPNAVPLMQSTTPGCLPGTPNTAFYFYMVPTGGSPPAGAIMLSPPSPMPLASMYAPQGPFTGSGSPMMHLAAPLAPLRLPVVPAVRPPSASIASAAAGMSSANHTYAAHGAHVAPVAVHGLNTLYRGNLPTPQATPGVGNLSGVWSTYSDGSNGTTSVNSSQFSTPFAPPLDTLRAGVGSNEAAALPPTEGLLKLPAFSLGTYSLQP